MMKQAISRPFPGRACLLGEHCDWYGGASLAIPLPMVVQATVCPRTRGLSITTQMDGTQHRAHWRDPGIDPDGGPYRFVPAAAIAIQKLGISPRPMHLDIKSNLPTGRGFSSSAAFCLAVLDAMVKFHGRQLSEMALAELAFHTEHDLLHVACGRLDPLSCVANMPVFFEWVDGNAPLSPIHPKVPAYFVVAALDAPRNTRAILDALQQPLPIIDQAMQIFAASARTGRDAIEAGDLQTLGEAMSTAQEAYSQLLEPTLPALNAPKLRKTVAQLTDLGAMGAKFSGAGGDGSVIGLFEHLPKAEHAAASLNNTGIANWVVPLG